MINIFSWSVGIESCCSPLVLIEFFTLDTAYHFFIRGKTAHGLK